MGRLEQERFQARTQRIQADWRIIPSINHGELFSMGIAPFPDHGRPCFVGSAIKSNPVTYELARNLSPNESRIANERFRAEIERILDGGDARRIGTMSAKENEKPTIYRLLIGEARDLKALMLYYTRGEFMGAPSIYLLAIAKTKDSEKVERIFEDNGYERNKSWLTNNKRVH